jgi:hypothetical protein
MLVAGLGIGPSFAVFTIVVQSAVAPSMLGAATSALTFFRQVGGSVGLAIAGTVFGTALTDQLPQRMAANGIPQPMIDAFVSQGGGNPAGELTGVGTDLGAQILNSVPAQVRPSVEPFIGQIVDSIYQAFSLAIANTMWLGLAGAVLSAAVVALLVPELTLRRATGGSGGGQAGGERQTTPIPTFE